MEPPSQMMHQHFVKVEVLWSYCSVAAQREKIMLYFLCMKFQAELVNFQDQLENRVLCKTFSSRQNLEVQPSVTRIEELKNTFECYNY